MLSVSLASGTLSELLITHKVTISQGEVEGWQTKMTDLDQWYESWVGGRAQSWGWGDRVG